MCAVVPPSCFNDVSATHKLEQQLRRTKTFNALSYLILSNKDAVTHTHTDMTGTCVFYHVLKGTKEFYVIEPTDVNLNLFHSYCEQQDAQTAEDDLAQNNSRKRLFLTHSQLDPMCRRVTVKAGQGIFMAINTIHLVRTKGDDDSIAIGINFFHAMTLHGVASAYREECKENIPTDKCFPQFIEFAITHIIEVMNRLGILFTLLYNFLFTYYICPKIHVRLI